MLRLALLDHRPVRVVTRLLRWYLLGPMRSSAFRVALAAYAARLAPPNGPVVKLRPTFLRQLGELASEV